MSIYEFVCRGCHHAFDLARSIDERDDLALCAACGSKDTLRNIAARSAHQRTASPRPPESREDRDDLHTMANIVFNGNDSAGVALEVGGSANLVNVTGKNVTKATLRADDGSIVRGRNFTSKNSPLGILNEGGDVEIENPNIE